MVRHGLTERSSEETIRRLGDTDHQRVFNLGQGFGTGSNQRVVFFFFTEG